MKTLLWKVMVLSLLISLSAFCFGQDPGNEREADHKMLRELRGKVTEAINKRDVDALTACLTKPFVLTFIDQTMVTTEEQLRDYLNRMFDGPDALIDDMKVEAKADVLTQFTSDNTGYCYGSSEDTYILKRGITSIVPSRWTATLVKQDGQWLIAAAHAGVNLIDNPVLSRSISAGRTLALIGTAAGLVVGLLAMWLLKLRKGQ